jgi:hypothetical protein
MAREFVEYTDLHIQKKSDKVWRHTINSRYSPSIMTNNKTENRGGEGNMNEGNNTNDIWHLVEKTHTD